MMSFLSVSTTVLTNFNNIRLIDAEFDFFFFFFLIQRIISSDAEL